jgi:ribonuclease-3
LHLFAARLENLEIQGVKDPKTRLQELLQAAALDLPVYEVVTLAGADHERIFTVNCTVASMGLSTTGTGSTRRGSEKSAAEKMIEAVQRHV